MHILFCSINVLTNQRQTIQIEDDLRNGIAGAVPVPPDEAGKEEVINSLVANVESMIEADRKVTSLKQLQVYIFTIHILCLFCNLILVYCYLINSGSYMEDWI